VIKAFDCNEGAPKAPAEIASLHAINKKKLHEFALVLAKRHVIEFLCQELDYSGIAIQDIRSIAKDTYVEKFGRNPHIRGRSSYWFTLAEWLTLLDVVGDFPLPKVLEKIARDEGLN
jgi:hypothetical protein